MKCFTHSFVLCLFWVGYSSQNALESAKHFDHDRTDGYAYMKKGLRRGLVSLRQRSIQGTFGDAYKSPYGNGVKYNIHKREATNSKILSSINLNIFNPNNVHDEFKREAHYSGSVEHGENTRMKRQAPEGGSAEQPPPRRGGRGGRKGGRGRGCNCKKGGKGDAPAEGAAEGGEEKKRRKRELSEDDGEALVRVRRQDAPEGGDEPPKNGGRGGRGGGRRGRGRGRRCRCPKPGDKKEEAEAPAEERKKRETVAGAEERVPWGKSGVSPRRLYYASEAGVIHRHVQLGVIVLVNHRPKQSSNVNHGRELAESNVLDKVENSDRKKREDRDSGVAEDKSVAKMGSSLKKDKKLKYLLKSHHLKRIYSVKHDKKSVAEDSKSSKMDEKVYRKKREADEDDEDESNEKKSSSGKKREADDDDEDDSKEKKPSSGARSVPGDKDTPGCYGRGRYGGGYGGGGGGGGNGGGGGGAMAGAGAGGASVGGEVEEYKKSAKYKKGKGKKKG